MKKLFNAFLYSLDSVINQYKYFSDNYLVKSNDENLRSLLKTSKDVNTLEKAVDELIHNNNGKPIEITLNNKKVSVSI